ncbi:Trp biosynthesis-associated membrane protein [Microbacterium sp.]|uniref:Trp biosynthesis-associated membrane protein n=1 Tax=Microbacterium sp. TaxID=51671 RepID=UPI00281208C6|nr:Trp biosynthesis-associated membrane protein [Microbacterium sp.]
MRMLRRARSIAVLGFLLAGGVGIISSTQTWLTVHRSDAGDPLAVPGADAIALLAPLSLAALALGAALAIAGVVLRYVIAALGAGAALVLTIGTIPLLADPPLSAVASTVTEATGLAGERTVEGIVDRIEPSTWPVVAVICWLVLFLASVFVLTTARRWKAGARRYRAASATHDHTSGPLDPVDSWDELSHGADPTN